MNESEKLLNDLIKDNVVIVTSRPNALTMLGDLRYIEVNLLEGKDPEDCDPED